MVKVYRVSFFEVIEYILKPIVVMISQFCEYI